MDLMKRFLERLNNLFQPRKNAPVQQPAEEATVMMNESAVPVENNGHPAIDEDPVGAFHDECHRDGLKAAVESGHTEVDEEYLETLQERAKGKALAKCGSPDHGVVFQKHIETNIQAKERDLREQRKTESFARSELMRRKDAVALLPPSTPRPGVPSALKYCAVLFIALSISPTIHDWIPDLFPALRWMLAGGWGVAVSYVLVGFIMPSEEARADQSGRSNQ